MEERWAPPILLWIALGLLSWALLAAAALAVWKLAEALS